MEWELLRAEISVLPSFIPVSKHCLAGNRLLKNIQMNEISLKIFNSSSSYFFF